MSGQNSPGAASNCMTNDDCMAGNCTIGCETNTYSTDQCSATCNLASTGGGQLWTCGTYSYCFSTQEGCQASCLVSCVVNPTCTSVCGHTGEQCCSGGQCVPGNSCNTNNNTCEVGSGGTGGCSQGNCRATCATGETATAERCNLDLGVCCVTSGGTGNWIICNSNNQPASEDTYSSQTDCADEIVNPGEYCAQGNCTGGTDGSSGLCNNKEKYVCSEDDTCYKYETGCSSFCGSDCFFDESFLNCDYNSDACSNYDDTDQATCESDHPDYPNDLCVWLPDETPGDGGGTQLPPGTPDSGGTQPPGGPVTIGGSLTNPFANACPTIEQCANKIIDLLIEVSIPIVAIMVLYGGFQIMTAGGDPEKFKGGKNTILYAAIGFVAVLAAKGVVGLVKAIFGA